MLPLRCLFAALLFLCGVALAFAQPTERPTQYIGGKDVIWGIAHAQPRIPSPIVTLVPPGTQLVCRPEGQTSAPGGPWYYCPEVRGYIAGKELQLVRPKKPSDPVNSFLLRSITMDEWEFWNITTHLYNNRVESKGYWLMASEQDKKIPHSSTGSYRFVNGELHTIFQRKDGGENVSKYRWVDDLGGFVPLRYHAKISRLLASPGEPLEGEIWEHKKNRCHFLQKNHRPSPEYSSNIRVMSYLCVPELPR